MLASSVICGGKDTTITLIAIKCHNNISFLNCYENQIEFRPYCLGKKNVLVRLTSVFQYKPAKRTRRRVRHSETYNALP